MDKEILTVNDYGKVISIQTAEEANKYLYDAEVVKKLTDECYENGFEDAWRSYEEHMFEEIRKNNMSVIERKDIIMSENKKTFDWNKANAIVGMVGGSLSIGIGVYQLVCMIRQQKALKRAALESQNDDEE